ncbi:MAG: helix-turn-helix domain-containing protein [Chloroflexi bacterium]|nr:helix-turn-helix domain-containing protein [Chloroflexota bacterium]
MPRQRRRYSRDVHVFPEDFPQRLERLKEESGLTWSELAARLGTNPLTVRRWRQGIRPNALHLFALLDVAASLGLAHLLPAAGARARAD